MLFLIYLTPETSRPSYFGLMDHGRGWVLEWLQELEHG